MAREIAEERGVSLEGIEGTGRDGTITVKDVRKALRSGDARPAVDPSPHLPREVGTLDIDEPQANGMWQCPHCSTAYSRNNPSWNIAAKNHLRRSHNEGWKLPGQAEPGVPEIA